MTEPNIYEKAEHEYSQLHGENSIRLLRLLPGEHSDEIHCQLMAVSLSDNPEYEALSYVWGDASELFEISCEGRCLKITRSLHSALRHLRHATSIRTIWADAVCINQQDNVEKSIQVQLMSKIYVHAHRVVVWLGEDVDGLALAFPAIEDIYRFLCQNEKDFPYAELPIKTTHDAGSPIYQELMRKGDWRRPFFRLLEQPWFTRRWIIQEISKARTAVMQCGLASVSWDKFVNAYWCLYQNGVIASCITNEDAIVISSTANLALIGEDARKNDHAPILETVASTRGFQCTDPRDFIYSVLGITGDLAEYGEWVVPDYSLSVADVYRRFVIGNITQKKNLYALSLLYVAPKKGALDLPSWVPDFSRMGMGNPLIRMRTGTGLPFRTGTAMPQETRVSEDGLVLYTKGIEVDHVALIVPCAEELPEDGIPIWTHLQKPDQRFNKWLLMLWTTFLEFSDDGKITGTSYEALWRTMIFELTSGQDRAPREYASYFFEYLLHRLSNTSNSPDPDQEESGHLYLIQLAMGTTLVDWRICRTKSGRLGRVLKSVEVGDAICVLFGGELPYAIRPASEGQHRFAGPTFVYGLMNGEAVAQNSTKGKEFAFV